MQIYLGDSLDILKTLPENSVDSVVTDPPYGLSFMGKKWDYDVPSVELWREVLRVLKPGGHLLSFGGTRTYHRLAVAIEDAGFEIRDQIQWIYGSGFPKSHNLKDAWQGWGSALKPANEPIVVARKPLEAKLTLAANVLKYGTGALNIDESRVGDNPGYNYKNGPGGNSFSVGNGVDGTRTTPVQSTQGRWPANVIFDEEAARQLDVQSGERPSGGSTHKRSLGKKECFGQFTEGRNVERVADSGGASRFFYCAKASKSERGEGNAHPTVKPIKLMEYLIKLVTPPNGCVLDPFAGSGTTGVAAVKLGFKFIGVERESEYHSIALKRVSGAKNA